jgi:hypothetical protein
MSFKLRHYPPISTPFVHRIKPVSRRWVLGGLVAAPAIVAASNIMPVRAMEWIGAPRWEGTAGDFAWICGPNPFATLATWERHLAMLKTLRDNIMNKAEMIEDAEEMIAWKEGGPMPMPKGMPMGEW